MAEMNKPEGKHAQGGVANSEPASGKESSKPHQKRDKRRDKRSDQGASSQQGGAQAAPPPPPPGKSGSGASGFFAFVALLVALGAGGGTYMVWQQMQQTEGKLLDVQAIAEQASQKAASIVDQVRADIEAVRSEVNAKIDAATEELSAKQAHFDESVAKISKQALRAEQASQAMQASLEGLYTRIGNTTRAWMVKEAEYLLEVANHRLLLERDVMTAMAALKSADQRLKAVGDPALLEVREAIASEIVALERVTVPDRAGIALSIGQIADQVESLPLLARMEPAVDTSAAEAAAEPASGEGETWWESLYLSIWNALKGLVTVRFNDRPVEALLPPEKASFLYQNLKLKLEQARLALLQYDTALYQASLEGAAKWLREYFDADAGEVQNVIAKLESLKNTDIAPTLPDVSTSLRVLHNVAERLQFNVDANADGAAE